MITEDRIDKICSENNMRKLKIGKFPSWINQDNTAGIELRAGKITFFNVEGGEKQYCETGTDAIMDIVKLIRVEKIMGESKDEKSNEAQDKKDEQETDKTKNALVSEKNNGLELPEFLTPALMSKWAKMSTTDRVLMFQKTPKDKIKQIAVGKNDKGVVEYAPYVEGNYMFKEANASFLFDWYLDDVKITVCSTGVSVVGRLYAYFTEYNKYLSRPATGYQEINKKVDTELAKKGATTDAIKKGLSLFGFNSDVYSGEV